MRYLLPLAVLGLVTALGSGCATAPSQSAQQLAQATGGTCHTVSNTRSRKVVCGDADYWAARRASEGFRCEKPGTKDELCAAAKDWPRILETRFAAMGEAPNIGAQMAVGAGRL